MTIIISADEIKKQLPEYKPKHSEYVHRKSSKLADKEFEKTLKESKLEQIILMCGGSASGKTEFLSEYLKGKKAIIFDGTLSTNQGAKIKLNKIIKAKKETDYLLRLS